MSSSTASGITVGIDLGTTFSAVARVNGEGRPEILSVEGESTMPSVALIEEDGSFIIGKEAVNQSVVKGDRMVQWIKRDMGEPVTRKIGGKEYTPEQVSAEILKKIVAEASAFLGEPVRRAIITCPAWFTDLPRKKTEEAGQMAGIEVLRIVNEPTAAAVYYGLENQLKPGDTLLVYDLGGGTFDCSIITCEKDGSWTHLSSEGHRKLGGHDWTKMLMDKVAPRLAEIFGDDPTMDPLTRYQLYDACERAKRNFAQMDTQSIGCAYQGRAGDVEVTRAEFEEWTEGLLQVTLGFTEKAVHKIDKEWKDLTHVLLVGGSTRLRRVPEALAQLTGKEPIKTGKEDTMVALGAAVLSAKEVVVGRGAKRRSVMVAVNETTQFALGVVTLGNSSDQPFEMAEMIPVGADLPAEKSRHFQTVVANQPEFDIPVVQMSASEAGQVLDGADPRKGVINRTYRFACLPNTPKGSTIEVTYRYSDSNIIDVAAADGRSGKKLQRREVQFDWPKAGAGGGGGVVDVCFVVDATSSMDPYIMGVKNEIGNFCRELGNLKMDWRLGLVEYRDLKYGEETRVYDWTNDVGKFRDWVSNIDPSGGGDLPESALDALVSAGEMPTRNGAARIVVLITDAPAHDPDQKHRSARDVAAILKDQKIKVFALSPRNATYETIVRETGSEANLKDFEKCFRDGDSAPDVALCAEVMRDIGEAVISTLLSRG